MRNVSVNNGERRMSRHVVASIIASTIVSGAVIAAEKDPGPDRGVRFNSPGVLDLADRSQKIAGGKAVVVAELPAGDAAEIFSASEQGEAQPGLRFSDDEFGCAKPSRKCSLEQERKRLASAGLSRPSMASEALGLLPVGAVKRDGKRLTITPASGAPVTFIDWTVAATKSADGDDETHWYLGRMPTSGYERVEVQFGHDAPGDFLINPQSGKVAFVHNGSDIAAPSPDGKLLVTFNTLNPPPSIRVAALDATGPRLVLQCEAGQGSTHVTPVFKGWHDANSFDLVLEIGEQSKSMVRLAMRLTRSGGNWLVAAGDLTRVTQIGFVCHDAADKP
jgi:hypothetical protein